MPDHWFSLDEFQLVLAASRRTVRVFHAVTDGDGVTSLQEFAQQHFTDVEEQTAAPKVVLDTRRDGRGSRGHFSRL